MPKRGFLAGAAPGVIAGFLAGQAAAQAVPVPNTPRPNPIANPDTSGTIAQPPFHPTEGVLLRGRPDYDPIGLRMGDIVIQPSLTASGVYNSNVFNTQNNTQEDGALELIPALRAIANLPRHALELLVSAHSLFYNRVTSENTTDVTADLRGRIDIDRRTSIDLNGGYSYLHEARGAPDLPGNAAEPTRYSAGNVQAALRHSFNRLEVSAGAELQRLDYRSTRLIPPGPAVLDNHDRDRNAVSAYGQAAYEFSPGYSAFLRGSYNDRSYDLAVDSAGFARDSHGAEGDAGIQFEITRLLVGQVYAGYLQQNFADPRFSAVSGGAFGAQLEWYPTQLTTVRFGVRHSVEETTIAGASSYTTSHFALGLDHELKRNLILSLDGVFEDNQYNDVPRTDRFWGVSVGAMYLINRNLQLNFGYVFSRRDSNLPGLDYSNNTVRASIVGKL